MPSETFFRLPEEKRSRIFEAALDEFAAYRFSDASINRIIKAAGIPRGSFYQYFKGKEDIYIYILREIGQKKLDIYNIKQAQEGCGSFYELMSLTLPEVFRWGREHPLYYRVGLLMMEDNSDFVRQLIEKMDDARKEFRQMLLREQEKGHIRADVPLEAVEWLVFTVSMELARDYYRVQGSDEALPRILSLFDIICHGVA